MNKRNIIYFSFISTFLFIICIITYIIIRLHLNEYINVNGYPIAYLENKRGICYINTLFQLFYGGSVGRFFIENNFDANSVEHKFKNIFMKMKNGGKINLQDDYITLFKSMNFDKKEYKTGGDSRRLLYLVIKYLIKNKKNKNYGNFRKIFEGIAASTIEKNSIKKYNFDRVNIEKEIYKIKKNLYGIYPQTISLLFSGYFKYNINYVKNNLKFNIKIKNKKYDLRSIAVLTGKGDKPTHIYSIIKAKKDWFILNDLKIKKIQQNEIYSHIISINILFYEANE
ncbi:hypothetical protein SLOPH_1126 [Spraguea lophii 42_110]|uniref:USP domain-containing protein n=1 Tax=Spraguea lophii (strain 42_110) TaxID=1358809 RepID=S7W6S3_SPRLO|nr:hypothetical protein SLOPH_1126 [Spraguea lophii 42_110]